MRQESSAPRFKREYWLQSLALTVQVTRNRPWPIIGLILLGAGLNIYGQNLLLASKSTGSSGLGIQLGLGLYELVEGLALFLLLCQRIPQAERPHLHTPFSTPTLSSFFSEYLRLIAQVLLWSLLLIIPGMVRFVQLSFVPFIVILNKDYQNGKVDALQLSLQQTKPFFWWILLITVLTTAIPLGLQTLVNVWPPMQNDVYRFLAELVSAGLVLWSFSFFYVLFRASPQELQPKK